RGDDGAGADKRDRHGPEPVARQQAVLLVAGAVPAGEAVSRQGDLQPGQGGPEPGGAGTAAGGQQPAIEQERAGGVLPTGGGAAGASPGGNGDGAQAGAAGVCAAEARQGVCGQGAGRVREAVPRAGDQEPDAQGPGSGL